MTGQELINQWNDYTAKPANETRRAAIGGVIGLLGRFEYDRVVGEQIISALCAMPEQAAIGGNNPLGQFLTIVLTLPHGMLSLSGVSSILTSGVLNSSIKAQLLHNFIGSFKNGQHVLDDDTLSSACEQFSTISDTLAATYLKLSGDALQQQLTQGAAITASPAPIGAGAATLYSATGPLGGVGGITQDLNPGDVRYPHNAAVAEAAQPTAMLQHPDDENGQGDKTLSPEVPPPAAFVTQALTNPNGNGTQENPLASGTAPQPQTEITDPLEPLQPLQNFGLQPHVSDAKEGISFDGYTGEAALPALEPVAHQAAAEPQAPVAPPPVSTPPVLLLPAVMMAREMMDNWSAAQPAIQDRVKHNPFVHAYVYWFIESYSPTSQWWNKDTISRLIERASSQSDEYMQHYLKTKGIAVDQIDAYLKEREPARNIDQLNQQVDAEILRQNPAMFTRLKDLYEQAKDTVATCQDALKSAMQRISDMTSSQDFAGAVFDADYTRQRDRFFETMAGQKIIQRRQELLESGEQTQWRAAVQQPEGAGSAIAK